MIELGKSQDLVVKRKVEMGSYLGLQDEEGEVVLLPKSQELKALNVGDKVNVFVYKDSEDRRVATMNTPKLQVGQVGKLKVVDTTKIGAFLDWGLDKDLLLPFKEQLGRVKQEDWIMVSVYIDKSERICATMRIYDTLSCENPFKEGDKVKGIVYDVKKDFGALVAVEGKYHGLIHEKELFQELKQGEEIEAKVVKKRNDGKLDLSIRGKAYKYMDNDAQNIYELLLKSKGTLKLHDKSSPEEIKRALNMSKNSFKKAIGRLWKTGKIELFDDHIEIKR